MPSAPRILFDVLARLFGYQIHRHDTRCVWNVQNTSSYGDAIIIQKSRLMAYLYRSVLLAQSHQSHTKHREQGTRVPRHP